MLEIIIALLISLGVNLDSENITVIDQSTGVSFGVGSSTSTSQRPNDPEEPIVYILLQDNAGNYYLERR
jgi:hypothetical protein